jgi:hypothetical protein
MNRQQDLGKAELIEVIVRARTPVSSRISFIFGPEGVQKIKATFHSLKVAFALLK